MRAVKINDARVIRHPDPHTPIWALVLEWDGVEYTSDPVLKRPSCKNIVNAKIAFRNQVREMIKANHHQIIK